MSFGTAEKSGLEPDCCLQRAASPIRFASTEAGASGRRLVFRTATKTQLESARMRVADTTPNTLPWAVLPSGEYWMSLKLPL